MKKTSLLLAVPAVLLSGLLISGCGMFRSTKAWETAQQESPLEIPPSLDRPSTSDALVIPPPGANQPTSVGATAGGQITDGFVLADQVDSAYLRVGQVLESGSLGQITGRDEAARTYTLSVAGNAVVQKKRGFFGRLFGRDKNRSASTGQGVARQVQVSVLNSGTDASEVRAEGNAAAVGKVIDTLKSRLGG